MGPFTFTYFHSEPHTFTYTTAIPQWPTLLHNHTHFPRCPKLDISSRTPPSWHITPPWQILPLALKNKHLLLTGFQHSSLAPRICDHLPSLITCTGFKRCVARVEKYDLVCSRLLFKLWLLSSASLDERTSRFLKPWSLDSVMCVLVKVEKHVFLMHCF